MSEEQPTFKVTDRRLFNADGTPREVEREEERPAPPAAERAEAGSAAASTSARNETTSMPESRAASQSARTSEAAAAQDPPHELDEFIDDGADIGADDPASFVNFIMSIASNAASSLGMMEHPMTGERGVDLQLAKHWIDVLGMLEQKTRGNLDPREAQILEGLLADLRMQFVSLSRSAPSKSPRGFTGRDITGGK